ncbi:hypothetical protein RB595_008399 [Gaeumannomyces hyphopodioides]
MQFTTATIITLLAAAASAAPAAGKVAAVSKMAVGSQWTIVDFKRTCNDADTSCAVSFTIDAGAGSATACAYKVDAAKEASRASAAGKTCGDYTVSSSWSGQFGEGQGFTTLAVVDNVNRLIAWPAYTDKQLVNGKAVSPDQSYTPARLG